MSERYFSGVLALSFFLLGDGARMVYSAFYLYVDLNPFVLVFLCSLVSFVVSLGVVFFRRVSGAAGRPGVGYIRWFFDMFVFLY